MNQFFEGLANQNNAEVTSVSSKESASLNLGGYLTITKGIISMDISYWCNLYASMYPDCISVDDSDWDGMGVSIGGVKIDSISKFNEGLTNMGLSSVSDNLKISDDEIRKEIYKAVGKSKMVKAVFGNSKLFDLMTFDEKKKVVLDYSIKNYEKCNPYTLNQYGLSESPNTKPSLEELLKLKK